MQDTKFERDPYRKLSGIYVIRSTLDNRNYVGSAVSIASRHKGHRIALLHSKHGNLPLQNFANKHGLDCLAFEVLEYCERGLLVEREQHWLDTLQPSFNILKVAGSMVGIQTKTINR